MSQAIDPSMKPTPPHPPTGGTPALSSLKPRPIASRMRVNRAFVALCLACIGLAILILAVLLVSVFLKGVGTLNLGFLRSTDSSQASEAGIYSGLVGTILLCTICALCAVPLGVGTAVLIEEFRPRNRWLRRAHGVVETNIRNLAGVPSIVYGILGVTAFATMFGLFGAMGAGDYAIGQSWHDEYVAEDRVPYYIPVDSRDAPPTLATAGMTYFTAKGSQETASLTFLSAEEVEPRKKAIQTELRTFIDAFKDELRAARGPRGRDPVSIGSIEQAEGIVDSILAEGQWASDPAALRADLVPLVLAMDGVEGGRALTEARRPVINLVVDREYSARMPGVMMVGKEPVRRDKKAWYYLALPLGRGVMAGGLTLMLVILPIIIVASQEALRAVPESYRQGALALGATRWQTVSKTALPAAVPGICTGTILSISRAIGEAAPLLILGAVGFLTTTPTNPMDRFSAMPIQIYFWTGKSDDGAAFQNLAASGIIVLLVVLLSFNALAIFIRQRSQKMG